MKKYILFICLTLVGLVGNTQNSNNYKDTSFKVFGECEQCKDRIELAAKMKGVKTAVWDVDTKMLLIQYNPSLIKLEKNSK